MSTRYSDWKLFHFPEKLHSLSPSEPILPPVHIRLKPTNRCNHRCRYCAYRVDHLQLGQDMREADSLPREKMLEIARDCGDMGVKAVTFSGGGEPLLYPHLLEGATVLRNGGVKLACLTNGSLLMGEIAEFFAHTAVWVRVSMDGWDNASYTRYRGVADGEYTRIMHNLEDFAKLGGLCVLGVSVIVDGDNAPHLSALLQRLKNAGVQSVKVSACITANDAAQTNATHAPYFDSVEKGIATAMRELGDETFEIINAWHRLDDRFAKSYDWCPFAQMLTVIGADACVYPCQDKAYNHAFKLGSLTKKSFHDYWNSAKETLLALCPSTQCHHHCVAHEKNRSILRFLDVDQLHKDFV